MRTVVEQVVFIEVGKALFFGFLELKMDIGGNSTRSDMHIV